MATKIKIVPNIEGFNAVRRSEGVRADLLARAERILEATGVDGFVIVKTENPQRSGVMVVANTSEARKAEATDKVLTKAIDAGRG
ncbi:hypothetical protein SAMN04489740_2686 [Arthrobacter alpinus]|uniref:Uncharacterized protein n=1 Tax=Arthrobacter alpinus TaxID=656366 RepID=A0A1H5M1W7_9MICC|nr:hypothetical protein [Arthrobacter alpinus]SEE82518.1 hypothetical protein SAMN04489740_2686 [Arthrobacter alpinus]